MKQLRLYRLENATVIITLAKPRGTILSITAKKQPKERLPFVVSQDIQVLVKLAACSAARPGWWSMERIHLCWSLIFSAVFSFSVNDLIIISAVFFVRMERTNPHRRP